MTAQITDMERYLNSMRKPLYDKMFFVDKIYHPIKYIVDFGCADGTLINALHHYFPNCKFIGYDNNPDMLHQAYQYEDTYYTSSWEEVLNRINPQDTLVVLSSVIHEIYSYGTAPEISQFWQRLTEPQFRYIAIRDMALGKVLPTKVDSTRARLLFKKQVDDFERIWGSINEPRNFLHFCLKYRYTANWTREVQENYFSLSADEMISKVQQSYEVLYQERFMPVYIREILRHQELKINFDENVTTHIKLLLSPFEST